jgi:hypothetical protein
MTDLMRSMGDEVTEDGRTRKEVVLDKLLALAMGGDKGAIQMVLDRVDGKPMARQEIDHSSQGEPLNATISFIRS